MEVQCSCHAFFVLLTGQLLILSCMMHGMQLEKGLLFCSFVTWNPSLKVYKSRAFSHTFSIQQYKKRQNCFLSLVRSHPKCTQFQSATYAIIMSVYESIVNGPSWPPTIKLCGPHLHPLVTARPKASLPIKKKVGLSAAGWAKNLI